MTRSIRYPCPYSAERLRELYWRESKSLQEIAQEAARTCGWERVPTYPVLLRWLREAGIARRAPSEVARLKARVQQRAGIGIFSADGRVKQAQAIRDRFAPILLGHRIVRLRPAAGEKRAQQQAQRTRKARRRPDYWYIGACGFCHAPIRRPRHRVRGAQVFCDRLCRNRYLNAQRQQTPPIRETRPCCGCGQPVTRRPHEFRRPTWFCSQTCRNRYLMAQGRGHPYTPEQQQRGAEARREKARALLLADRAQRARHAERTGEVLLDIEQAAELLGVSQSALSRRIRRGEIRPAILQPRRLFRKEDLLHAKSG
jgi:endogenous inhibitor of DNA gyrase (YacG/DUF329 family)